MMMMMMMLVMMMMMMTRSKKLSEMSFSAFSTYSPPAAEEVGQVRGTETKNTWQMKSTKETRGRAWGPWADQIFL